MKKDSQIIVRTDPPVRKRLDTLRQQTGLGYSEIVRQLISTATVEPVTTFKLGAGALKNSGLGVTTTQTAESVRN